MSLRGSGCVDDLSVDFSAVKCVVPDDDLDVRLGRFVGNVSPACLAPWQSRTTSVWVLA